MTKIYYCETPGGTEIKDGGETTSRKVLLSVDDGPPNSGWEMVHNMGYAKPFQLNSSGAETVHMENLVPGENLFQVREHSSASPISQWVVNVKEVTAELTIDPTPMTLDQHSFFNSYGWLYIPQNESSATRPASGGVLPYQYASSNQDVATVDGYGKVIARRNGTVTITVTDAAGSSVFYIVRVFNVYQTIVNNGVLTADEARTWTVSVGGNVDSTVETLQITHLANWARDVFDNRLYPDPLSERFTQIQPLGMLFRQWAGTSLGGSYWPWGSPQRMRVITSVPT
ncbi:Ig-like domain-containing protein [Pseudomonas sp. 3-2]|jgi:hypothetical protein|uniref:Ig-like domain-containing protein n=1 Tax=Pseudomonas sp. 3-2 TaxID=2867408 RepID=UPI001C873B8F|nr:Ig-like domain-containing protein [Pseudomonas sp. 3-2]QZD73386.1 Ig-like domain-containing protein [Pseudomonas sp. 3-2]